MDNLEKRIRDVLKTVEEERRLGDKRAEQFYDSIKASPDFGTIDEPNPVEIVGGDFLLYYDIGLGVHKKIEVQDLPHDLLAGLGDDDHTQYHNDARGDARYYTETEINAALDMTNRVVKNTCLFRAYATTDQNNLTDNTWTTVVLGSEDYDRGGDFASNAFTAPVTGYYDLKAVVQVHDLLDVTSGDIEVRFYKNGSTQVSHYVLDTEFSTASRVASLPLHDQLYLTASNTIVVQVKNNYGGSNLMDITSGTSKTYFTGRLVAV